MRIAHHKEYSRCLGRDMEFNVYGHSGKPALAFPCQDGRFFDWEGFGMVETLADYLEAGRLQLFTVDSSTGKPSPRRTAAPMTGSGGTRPGYAT